MEIGDFASTFFTSNAQNAVLILIFFPPQSSLVLKLQLSDMNKFLSSQIYSELGWKQTSKENPTNCSMPRFYFAMQLRLQHAITEYKRNNCR